MIIYSIKKAAHAAHWVDFLNVSINIATEHDLKVITQN